VAALGSRRQALVRLALGGRAAASAARVAASGRHGVQGLRRRGDPLPAVCARGRFRLGLGGLRQAERGTADLARDRAGDRPDPRAGSGLVDRGRRRRRLAVALHGTVVYRIAPASNRVAAQIGLGTEVPYLWAGAGALWVADDPGRALVRVDPGTNRPGARIPVGDGPAGFVVDGGYIWVLNHRENSLDRIDPGTNAVVRMASGLGPADNSAAERIASFGGSLWVTGRGLDLLRVSPVTGAVLGTTEIGPAGVDVRSDGVNLWLVSYDAAAEPRGDPVAGAVLRIAADGSVRSSVAPTRRLFANGVAAADGALWLLDSVAGLLLRLPA
jgi:streptogramin lyase